MKIKAVIFASNDNIKLDFTLKHFTRNNPDIPVLLYNNGNTEMKEIADKYNCAYQKIDNIWHKQTSCGIGSFNYDWFKYVFDFALQEDDYTHILFLETDIYTRKKIKIEPKFDMAGPLGFANTRDNTLFNYFNLKELGYTFNQLGGRLSFPHTGCGGTIYTKEFFYKTKENLYLIKKVYEEKIESCYMDLIMTYLGIISGCSIGEWEEASNVWGHYRKKNKSEKYQIYRTNWNAAMIHKIKYENKFKLQLDIMKSKLGYKVFFFRVYTKLKEFGLIKKI